jgi:hypothetical protein
MEVGKESFTACPADIPDFKIGDMVQVFEGAGAGNVKTRDVFWFGRVVGREGKTYLMRNRILIGKGSPNRVEGKYLKLQKDSGLHIGSEKRVHFRTLSKRTRERQEQSSDERHNWKYLEAQKKIVK